MHESAECSLLPFEFIHLLGPTILGPIAQLKVKHALPWPAKTVPDTMKTDDGQRNPSPQEAFKLVMDKVFALLPKEYKDEFVTITRRYDEDGASLVLKVE